MSQSLTIFISLSNSSLAEPRGPAARPRRGRDSTCSPQVWHVVGHFTFEAYAGLWFFTDNREFFGKQTKLQDPLAVFQVHVSYSFRNGIWIAVSSRQSVGGAVTIACADRLEPETNNRVGVTFSMPVMSRYALKLIATTGVTATMGNDYNTFTVAWQVVF